MPNWLKPPSAPNELEQIAYSSLHYTLWVSIILAFLIIVPSPTITHLTHGIYGLIFLSVSLILLRKHKLYAAGILYLGGTWLTITVGIYSLNGINNALLFMYIVIIIYANVIFAQRKMVWLFMGASVGSLVILTIGQANGILPLQESDPIFYDRLIIAATAFTTSGILLSVTSYNLRQNFQNLQKHEEALKQQYDELKNLNHELRISRARYRLLFDNTGTLALVYDNTGKVVLHNMPAEQMLGTPDLDWARANIYDILDPAAAKEMIQAYEMVLQTNADKVFDGTLTLNNGQVIEHLTHIIPLPQSVSDASNHPQVLALTTDVTAKNEAERQMADLQLAREKLSFFTEFFGIVSHDIKTPLTVIKTSAYLLRNAENDTKREHRIHQIEKQIDTLDQYVQDMLVISRLDQVPTINKQQTNICDLVDHIIEQLRPRIEQKKVQIAIEKQSPRVLASLDKDQMHRALLNIVENAVNYTPESGLVSISLQKHDKIVQISVQDTGIGIPDDDIPHIFEPFYRSQAARQNLASGSGLGLAIVNRIIELHQGQIQVFSEFEQGTLFKISLPVA